MKATTPHPLHVIESERLVCARATAHPAALAALIRTLGGRADEAFADPDAYALIRCALDLLRRGEPVTPRTVRLEAEGQGVNPSEAFWEEQRRLRWRTGEETYHLRQVRLAYHARQAATRYAAAAVELGAPGPLSPKEGILQGVASDALRYARPEGADEDATATAARLEETIFSEDPSSIRIKTGIGGLDRKIRGLLVGRVSILAARTGMGKTAVADHIALAIARREAAKPEDERGQVVISDIENTLENKRLRLVATLAGVSIDAIEDHMEHVSPLSAEEARRVREAIAELARLPLRITQAASAVEVHAAIRAAQAERPVAFCVVDYAQIMREDGQGQMERVMNAIGGLHAAATTLGVPILLLSQISKAATHGDGIPTLTDLAWSDDLAQKAATVLMAHHPHTHWSQNERDSDSAMGFASTAPPDREYWLFVRKHKGPGEGRAVELRFDKGLFRISEPESHRYGGDGASYYESDREPVF